MRLRNLLNSFSFKISSNYEIQRLARLAVLASIIAIIVLSLAPNSERPHTGMPKELEHFIAYAGAGVFLPLASLSSSKRLIGWICFAVASGVFEVTQKFVPGRTPSPTDALASICGLTFGTICGALFATLLFGKNSRIKQLAVRAGASLASNLSSAWKSSDMWADR